MPAVADSFGVVAQLGTASQERPFRAWFFRYRRSNTPRLPNRYKARPALLWSLWCRRPVNLKKAVEGRSTAETPPNGLAGGLSLRCTAGPKISDRLKANSNAGALVEVAVAASAATVRATGSLAEASVQEAALRLQSATGALTDALAAVGRALCASAASTGVLLCHPAVALLLLFTTAAVLAVALQGTSRPVETLDSALIPPPPPRPPPPPASPARAAPHTPIAAIARPAQRKTAIMQEAGEYVLFSFGRAGGELERRSMLLLDQLQRRWPYAGKVAPPAAAGRGAPPPYVVWRGEVLAEAAGEPPAAGVAVHSRRVAASVRAQAQLQPHAAAPRGAAGAVTVSTRARGGAGASLHPVARPQGQPQRAPETAVRTLPMQRNAPLQHQVHQDSSGDDALQPLARNKTIGQLMHEAAAANKPSLLAAAAATPMATTARSLAVGVAPANIRQGGEPLGPWLPPLLRDEAVEQLIAQANGATVTMGGRGGSQALGGEHARAIVGVSLPASTVVHEPLRSAPLPARSGRGSGKLEGNEALAPLARNSVPAHASTVVQQTRGAWAAEPRVAAAQAGIRPSAAEYAAAKRTRMAATAAAHVLASRRAAARSQAAPVQRRQPAAGRPSASSAAHRAAALAIKAMKRAVAAANVRMAFGGAHNGLPEPHVPEYRRQPAATPAAGQEQPSARHLEAASSALQQAPVSAPAFRRARPHPGQVAAGELEHGALRHAVPASPADVRRRLRRRRAQQQAVEVQRRRTQAQRFVSYKGAAPQWEAGGPMAVAMARPREAAPAAPVQAFRRVRDTAYP